MDLMVGLEKMADQTAEQRVTLMDGRTLGFAEYGDPNGEPVLEFHGWPSSRLEASYYDDAGKKVGARVIGIDRPGFGISTYTKGYRIVNWPSDVVEFANALGLKRFSVMGICSGSPYALACARFIPERVTGCAVVGGVCPLRVEGENLNPRDYVMAEEVQLARLANLAPWAAKAVSWCFLRDVRKDITKALGKDPPPSELELLKTDEAKRAFFQQSIAEGSRSLRGSIESLALELRDWSFLLQDITSYVSIWHGEADHMMFPACAKYLASKLPNHTLHLIPGTGHLGVIWGHAEEVLRELLATNRHRPRQA
jgi:pimeloyl-ACP methyl ester carboxylesterase